MSDNIVLKGPRKHEVRILEGKSHLCTTIGGVIVKDLGQYDYVTKKVCGEPVYTDRQLEEMNFPIEEKIKEAIRIEERERLAIMRRKEEAQKQREFEQKVKREREELELREHEARVKKLERQNEKYRRVGDESVSKLPPIEKVEEKLEKGEVDLGKELIKAGWLKGSKLEDKTVYKAVGNKRLVTATDNSKKQDVRQIIQSPVIYKIEEESMTFKRTLFGKEYVVKLNSSQEISHVWDDVQKIYIPYQKFVRDKSEYIAAEDPKIAVTTNTNVGISTSGTGPIFPNIKVNTPIPKLEPKLDIGIGVDKLKDKDKDKDEDKEKDKEKKEGENKISDNMIDEYIDILYGGI